VGFERRRSIREGNIRTSKETDLAEVVWKSLSERVVDDCEFAEEEKGQQCVNGVE